MGLLDIDFAKRKLAQYELEVNTLIAKSGQDDWTYFTMSTEEVEGFLNEEGTFNANYRSANPGGGSSGLVIVCYDPGGPTETCFGIWGTDDCGDVNCDGGCDCREIPD